MASTLGYWDIRGLAEPIRCLLTYVEEKFVDKRLKIEFPLEECFNTWMQQKFTLGLEMPNLPYYIDEKVKMTESVAILRYLGRKYKMDAQTEEESIRLDMVEQYFSHLRMHLGIISYITEGYEASKKSFLLFLPVRLQTINFYLEGKDWMLGDRLTYADFLAYDTLDMYQLFKSDCLDDFPNVKKFMDKFQALPKVKAYLENPKFPRWPLYFPIATFGGDRKQNDSKADS